MTTNRNYFKLCLLLSFLMLATALPAQKRKMTKRKKARVTNTTKNTSRVEAVPIDSLIGKSYAGKIGQTVVDFFGTRTTYGDVTQQIYVWHDSTAVIYQRGGDEESYKILPYTLSGTTLKIGDYSYTTVKNGAALQLQKMSEGKETRQGTLTSVSPVMMSQLLYMRGKYLDGMTIQTEEDKKNALICLNIAAENGQKEAQTYLYNYYKKRAEKGESIAIKYMYEYEKKASNYTEAHKYCDMMISSEPQNALWLCEKGLLYLAEGKTSDAKKILKKVKKVDNSYIKDKRHPFIKALN